MRNVRLTDGRSEKIVQQRSTPKIRMTEILFGYPLHLERLGPISYVTTDVKTESLDGVHLDFYYLLATEEFATIAIDFIPAGLPYRVRVQTSEGLVDYKRTADESTMRTVVNSKYGALVQKIHLSKGHATVELNDRSE